jgi:hypothetical protein
MYLRLPSLLIDLGARNRQVCTDENDDCCLSRKKREKNRYTINKNWVPGIDKCAPVKMMIVACPEKKGGKNR